MKHAIQSLVALLLGISGIVAVALLANRFKHHALFATVVYGAIVILLGVYYWLHRRAQRDTNPGRGG